MDMIVKLPPSSGFDSILVFVDLLSKATHFVACKGSMNARNLVCIFGREVVCLHGLPDCLVSDCGTLFTSAHWVKFLSLAQIQSALSTAYHPQTNGQTERMNQIL
jgi:transposase InsO family protein